MRSGLFLLALFFQLITAAQGRQLVMAEYFVDIDPGAGLATSMTAADGSFDQALEQALNTAVAEATPGHHLVGVRLKGQDGAWSNTFRTIFYQNELQPARSLRVNLAEAFIDNDPGAGNATPMLAFDGNFDQALEGALIAGIPLDPGPHLVGVRVRDASGTWSNTFRTVVFHNGLIPPRVPSVQLAELYLDQDPSAGSATPMLAFDGSLDGALETVFANGL
ncbi:MAG: hypothetical protein IT229_12350, partial [Flavobacteriales bacterium]|nr:hypothetical protein [Flavobacteriales bacterium]